MLFAPFLLSVAMMGSVAVALFYFRLAPKLVFGLRPELKLRWKGIKQRPDFWILTALFFLTFWGIWDLQDSNYWISRLRIKIPFLVLPLAFYCFPKLPKRSLDGLLYWFVLLLSITCVGVFINYLLDYEAINKMIKEGRSIPVPSNHVRYSLMVAFGMLVSFYLYQQKYRFKYSWEPKLQLGLSIFLFIFIHFLSVRTGIVIAYATLVILCFRYIYLSKRYLVGLVLMGGITLAPIIAFYTMPSLRAKVGYMKYDLYMYQRGHEDAELSDAGRWLSLSLGWEVFQTAPILGVGTANLKKEIMARYDERYPNIPIENRKMPHNQFLSVLAANGMLGLLFFLVVLFIPLFYRKNYKHWLLLGFYIAIVLSFMVENTIENALGAGFFLFYLLLLLLNFVPVERQTLLSSDGK